MIVTLIFLVALAGFLAWWLARQGLMSKPWLETGAPADIPGAEAPPPTAKIGLGVFLAIAGTLLMLLVSAYAVRMDMEDWRPLPWPQLLWANTGVLVVSSLALHRAQAAARRAARDETRSWLWVGGLAAIAFLVGQILAWRQLAEAGYRPATNPADAFFYLLTAVHGLHVLGGLIALARAGRRLSRRDSIERLRLSVELCATYWHFLLAAWILLFVLLAYAPVFPWLYAICRAPFG